MRRVLLGAMGVVAMLSGGLFLWQAQTDRASAIPPAPAARQSLAGEDAAAVELAPPPAASEKTREEKRFARYDKDKNGAVGRDEYLMGRRKGFAKLDVNGDGRLSFDEYATKGVEKFAAADRDRSGQLTASEFALTRVIRKAKPKRDCAPVRRPQPDEDEA